VESEFDSNQIYFLSALLSERDTGSLLVTVAVIACVSFHLIDGK
jgi:hypothetical protein